MVFLDENIEKPPRKGAGMSRLTKHTVPFFFENWRTSGIKPPRALLAAIYSGFASGDIWHLVSLLGKTDPRPAQSWSGLSPSPGFASRDRHWRFRTKLPPPCRRGSVAVNEPRDGLVFQTRLRKKLRQTHVPPLRRGDKAPSRTGGGWGWVRFCF